MGARTYLKSLDRGYPGSISRTHQGGYTIESKITDAGASTSSELFFGSPVVWGTGLKIGKVVPVEAVFTAATFAGFVVRPFPTQGQTTVFGVADPIIDGTIVPVMRRGYMTVKNVVGVPAAGGAVYITTSNPTALIPLGSIQASATNGTAVVGAYFTGTADANGVVEIEFSI